MWAPKTHQVLIASKPIVNKSKPDIMLLIEHLMLASAKYVQQPADNPKPRKKPRKRLCIKNKTKHNDSIEIEILDENLIIKQLWMRVESAYDL